MIGVAFEDTLNTVVTIGKLAETNDHGDITTSWQTLYVAKAKQRTLQGRERMLADTNQVFATDRWYLLLTDRNGVAMDLDETLELVEADLSDENDDNGEETGDDPTEGLVRYRFKLVAKRHNHHFGVDTLRVEPGGS